MHFLSTATVEEQLLGKFLISFCSDQDACQSQLVLLLRPNVRCACQVPRVLCLVERCFVVVCSVGGGETGSPSTRHQVWRLRQRRPRVLRRKRGCTLALFLATSRWPFYVVSVYFGGGRIGTFTFLLTLTWCFSEEEGQPPPHISPVCTSEEEGQAFLLTISVSSLMTSAISYPDGG